jgi:hypothetical protein
LISEKFGILITVVKMASKSHTIAQNALREILEDFNLSPGTSQVTFIGDIPSPSATKSHQINLSLIGTTPALANAVVAAQIYESRSGKPQTISVDLSRGHNYIDPDIGMTPTTNGQETVLDMTRGNPFLQNIFETRDGRYVVLSAVYVDLVYQWTAFLGCSVFIDDVRAAIKKWHSSGTRFTNRAADMYGI